MNKYDKILHLIGNIVGFSFSALIALALVTAPIFLIYQVGYETIGILFLLFELCLCCAIHFVSFSIGLWFLGDYYKPTGHVSRGHSLELPNRTYEYVKRVMITNFIETIACALFSIAYIVFICLGLFTAISICGLIASIIALIIFYLFYKKQQHNLKHDNLQK